MRLKTFQAEELRPLICVVVGTRPSIVKQSPVIRELERRTVPYFIAHTGQHYSYSLDRAFFEDLALPEPRHRLSGIENHTLHGAQTAAMLSGLERILVEERPRVVVVGGDANTNLSGALAARKLNQFLVHDEAGLRSNEWLTPEEHNRVMMDHISDLLLAPNERAATQLREEHVRGRIEVTGSTTVDAVVQNVELARAKSRVLEQIGVQPGEFLLVTMHHEENVDYPDRLRELVAGIKAVAAETHLPLVLPLHPRTRDRLGYFGLLDGLRGDMAVRIAEPVGYFDFLALLGNARLVMTDSGGVIQEACILGIPCCTFGTYTEWTETLAVGANTLTGHDRRGVLAAATKMLPCSRDWSHPFGAVGVAARVVDLLVEAAGA